MEVLEIQKTEDTPEIKLDPEKGHFEFQGKAFPDDAKAVFQPVVDWLEKYIENPKDKIKVDFKFTYFNTASSKMILEILDRLYKLQDKGTELSINWHYKEVDEDMLDAGEEYSDIIELPFNFISYS
jgi:hypothetical protein